MFLNKFFKKSNNQNKLINNTDILIEEHDISMKEYNDIIDCLNKDYGTDTSQLNSIEDKQNISFRIKKLDNNKVDFKIKKDDNIIYDWDIIGEQCPIVKNCLENIIYILHVNLNQNNTEKNFSNDNNTITNWVNFLNRKRQWRNPIQQIQNTQIKMFKNNQRNKENINVLFIHDHLVIEKQNKIKQKIKDEYFQNKEINILSLTCNNTLVDISNDNYKDMFDFIWVDDSCDNKIGVTLMRLNEILKKYGKIRYHGLTNDQTFNTFFLKNNNKEDIYIPLLKD